MATMRKKKTNWQLPVLFILGISGSVAWWWFHRTPKISTLYGRITDATAGSAVAGATVTLGSYSAVSDAGNYEIVGITPGTYSGTCVATGFYTEEIGVTIPGGRFRFDIPLTAVPI